MATGSATRSKAIKSSGCRMTRTLVRNVPFYLRRNDKDILRAYQEFWDKVWWNRHQVWVEKINSGQEPLSEAQRPVFAQATKAAQRIEKK